MSSIFGWSYPPGCSGPPDDDTTCLACGLDSELEAEKGGCNCSPCPVCEEPGCLTHLDSRQLAKEIERLRMVLHSHEAEARKRYAAKPCLCLGCKQPLTYEEAHQQDGMPAHPACEAKYRAQMEDWI
jgi:hypothetical protein